MAFRNVVIASVCVIITFLSINIFSFVFIYQNGRKLTKKSALLVAGSQGFVNYRHQTAICGIFQVLKKNAIPTDNIITMLVDDVAFSKSNPEPGVLRRKPGGENLYIGVNKDYTGKSVTTRNFYAILAGDASALVGGDGKVLRTNHQDNIFIYYSDHGNYRMLGMPDGVVKAETFINLIKYMHKNRRFKNMFVTIEACYSGSLFEGLLPENINVYAMTSACTNDNSVASYCNDDFCLGGQFSNAWINFCEKHDPHQVTVGDLFRSVKAATTKSEVSEYGDKKIKQMMLADFICR